MRASLGSSNVSKEALASPPDASPHEHDHFVQFYDSDSYLTEMVRDFVVGGLRNGEDTVVVATQAHLEQLDAALEVVGIDVRAVRSEGRYRSFNAAAARSEFMVDGDPDRSLFEELIEKVTAHTTENGRVLRIFGEMVALLWDEGNIPAVIRLEEFWNSILEAHPIALMCAYPMRSFSRERDTEQFNEVCDRHSRVLPTEDYALLEQSSDRLLAVAQLQQRVFAEETERRGMKIEHMQLADALERLKELDRLRNDFVAMVVHDIRTPNAVIGAFLHVLRKDWATLDDERIRDFLTRAIANTAHVTRLVDDILTVSRIESGDFGYDMKPFDIVEIVYRAVGAAREANDKLRFEVSAHDGLPAALGDEARQLQILNNLLSNAAKFSAEMSTVSVAVRREGYHLRIDVRDEGLGIAKTDQVKLFKRFSRVESGNDPKIKGTGLGLYITKALVEGQGGSISVTSELGAGSTFSYTVPAANRRSAD